MRKPFPYATLAFFVIVAVVGACQGEARAGGTVLKNEDNFLVTAAVEPVAGNPLAGKVLIDIEARAGWKVSHEAPMLIEVIAPEALKVTNLKLRNKDMLKPKAEKPRFEVPFTAAAKGTHELKLKFDVVLCTEKMCQKKRFEAPFKVTAG